MGGSFYCHAFVVVIAIYIYICLHHCHDDGLRGNLWPSMCRPKWVISLPPRLHDCDGRVFSSSSKFYGCPYCYEGHLRFRNSCSQDVRLSAQTQLHCVLSANALTAFAGRKGRRVLHPRRGTNCANCTSNRLEGFILHLLSHVFVTWLARARRYCKAFASS